MAMNYRKLLYKPTGKAKDYSGDGYAANLYKNCSHACKYCYSPGALRMTRDRFHSAVTTAPDMLQRLASDMKRVGVLNEPIFLCFSCDPYCVDNPEGMTREAIKIIIGSGNSVNILTKGGMLACEDFDLLVNTKSRVGTTLTFYSFTLSQEWEPRAAQPGLRLLMLEHAKNFGIETWASIEPVIIPEQSLSIMETAMPWVDTFKIGRWNHDKRASAIDWAKFKRDAVALCEKYGKKHVLKKDLIEA
jgi:DNA repair photolyase